MMPRKAKLIVEEKLQNVRFPIGAVIHIPRNRHPNTKKSLWMIMSQFLPDEEAYHALDINTLEFKYLYAFVLARGKRIA